VKILLVCPARFPEVNVKIDPPWEDVVVAEPVMFVPFQYLLDLGYLSVLDTDTTFLKSSMEKRSPLNNA
jgi:hypothetical protein